MAALAQAVMAGDRRALARAITLVESRRSDHAAVASALLQAVMPATGGAVRVGISGAPGVGKSTFVEALGSRLVERDLTIAVLAIDPSSTRSGGSILGDKTRMGKLARAPQAFIRPTPAGRTQGGVARRTREALLLCEAAGFDVVVVETVGVGQSEVAVAAMVDCFVLLVAPGGGDDLQGIKRGVMELADVVVVTKADGDLAAPARLAAADYGHALGLLRPRSAAWKPRVLLCSAVTGAGVAEVWAAVEEQRQALVDAGEMAGLRAGQARNALWADVHDRLGSALRSDPAVAATAAGVERSVVAGELAPSAGADRILAAFRSGGWGGPRSEPR